MLVGETGTGKTTACQLAAFARGQRLHIINCNQHTESADFLGGYRPNRRRERAVADFRAALEAFNAASPEKVPVEIASSKAVLQAAEAAERIAAHFAGSDAPDGHLQALAATLAALATAACAPFEWADGPLVQAMVNGDMLLIDELNLAEDAVLERLNR